MKRLLLAASLAAMPTILGAQASSPAKPAAPPPQKPAAAAPAAPATPAARTAPVVPAASHEPVFGVTEQNALVKQYCTGCHSDRGKAGQLTLASFDASKAADPDNLVITEKMIRKLRAGMMPP